MPTNTMMVGNKHCVLYKPYGLRARMSEKG